MFMELLKEADDFIFLVSCLFKITVFLFLIEMEMNDSKLGNEMGCAIKVCYRLRKTAPETGKLTKETYKDA